MVCSVRDHGDMLIILRRLKLLKRNSVILSVSHTHTHVCAAVPSNAVLAVPHQW